MSGQLLKDDPGTGDRPATSSGEPAADSVEALASLEGPNESPMMKMLKNNIAHLKELKKR